MCTIGFILSGSACNRHGERCIHTNTHTRIPCAKESAACQREAQPVKKRQTYIHILNSHCSPMESNVHELLRNCTHFYREISIVCCAVALLCFCFGTCIVHANAHRPRVSRKRVGSHRRGRLR